MDSSSKVLSRFLTAEAVADPKVALANFAELIRRAEEQVPEGTTEKALELLKEAETYRVLKDYPRWEEYGKYKSLSYRVAAWIKMLAKNAYIHGFQLFLSIVQTISLPPGLRKKVEMAARAYAREPRPRVPKDFGVFAAYDKLKQTLKEHYAIAAAAIAQGTAHGDEGPAATKVQAGPFTLVNTGGFSAEQMQNAVSTVEAAAGLIQRSGLGEVLYGDILITGKLDKANVLAFYLRNKDEMFIRADVKKADGVIKTVCHELGHRYEAKFLKGRSANLDRLFRTIGGQERERQNGIKAEVPPPKVGDTITEGKRTYEVVGFGFNNKGRTIRLERVDKPGTFSQATFAAWTILKHQEMGGSREKEMENPNYKGFVTPYASTDPAENFAEMFAFYCLDRLPTLQSQLFEEIVFGNGKLAARVADRFASYWTQKFDIRKQHPEMDASIAKLFDAAMTLTRDTHETFQNAKAGIGGPTADDWEDIAEAYEKAIRLWNRALDSKKEHLGSMASSLLDRADNTRKVCIDREKEARKQLREALDQERIDSNRP